MKNQNDLIVTIVAFVLALGAAAGFYFGARKPIKPQDPEPVPTTAVQVPEGSLTMSNSLPGGGGGGGGFAGRRGGAAGGAALGPGGKWANLGPGGPGAPPAMGRPAGAKGAAGAPNKPSVAGVSGR